jgi:hypothetical protein
VAHAHHFLERLDRVTREQTEFALGLYRDHEAVRYVLDHVNLPAAAERVAIAIDDAREGPFVIVTREGRFVTCLGKGMHQDHPVVPRGQVDGLLAKVADQRARRELAQRELRPDEDEDDIFQRVLVRGSRLAREDFIAVSAFEPMLGLSSWQLMTELSIDAAKMRLALVREASRTTVIKDKTARALEGMHRLEWAVAHLMLLSCLGERRTLDLVLKVSNASIQTPTFYCATQSGLPFFLRSTWAAARLGRSALPRYKQVLAQTDGWEQLLDAGLGLGAIALRHAGSAAEIRRFLLSYEEPPPGKTDMEAARGWVARAVARAIDGAEEREQGALKIGREYCVAAGQSLPEGHALRFASTDDVPEALARTAALAFDADTWDPTLRDLIFVMLPVSARASAEDFYFPREVVRAWFGPWQPEETLERVTRITRASPPRQPVRAAPTPGRNDPCTCGSGKKWKKCHGAGKS